MAYTMFQFRHNSPNPSLKDFMTQFEVREEQIDTTFGIIPTDSEENLFVVMVADEAEEIILKKLKELGLDKDPAIGLFSNPKIEPFDDFGLM